jgi:signal transduction histidine kinase
MPKNSCADELARELVAARVKLRRAAQVLHDDVGSLLAVAGLRLQLLRMDFPATEARAAEVSEALEGVMGHLRSLSRELEPSPVRRTGLKNALLDLAESRMEASGVDIALRYTAIATLPPAAADAVFQAVDSAVAAGTAKDAGRITITVSGKRSLTARVGFRARPRKTAGNLECAGRLATHAGLRFDVAVTKGGTIVSISHAIQRSSRG